MAGNRRGGTIFLKVDGAQHEAKGEFSYNIGQAKRTAIVGASAVHGYSDEMQVPFIEGAITDSSDIKLKDLLNLDGVTVTLELANGKTIILREAWYANDGTVKTKEGEIPVRFEGKSGEEA